MLSLCMEQRKNLVGMIDKNRKHKIIEKVQTENPPMTHIKIEETLKLTHSHNFTHYQRNKQLSFSCSFALPRKWKKKLISKQFFDCTEREKMLQ